MAPMQPPAWRIHLRQLGLLIHYLGLLRIRHYLRLAFSLILLFVCVPANVWVYRIIDSVLFDSQAASGMVGINLVDSSNYWKTSRSFLLAENSTDFSAVQSTLLARNVPRSTLTRCSSWSDCQHSFLTGLHSTLLNKYVQAARLDSQGRPVQVECSGGSDHALNCAYFMQLLMRPNVSLKKNDSATYLEGLAAGGAAFKEVGFLRFVVKQPPKSNDGPFKLDEFGAGEAFGPALNKPELTPVPDTPCTRAESLPIFGAVSFIHSVLLLTALAALLLQADLFPLSNLRRAGFLRLMYFSGFKPSLAWLAACLWGLGECLLAALAVAVSYRCQCPGAALESDRICLIFLAVACAAAHYFACGLLTACRAKFGFVVLTVLFVHLLSITGSFVVLFSSESYKPMVKMILSFLLPGSQLDSLLLEAAVPVSGGGQANPLRSENSLRLLLGFLSSLLISLEALYADTAHEAAPSTRGRSPRLCCYPLLRLCRCFSTSQSDVNEQADRMPPLVADGDIVQAVDDANLEAVVKARNLGKIYDSTGESVDEGDGGGGGGCRCCSLCCCCFRRDNQGSIALDNFSADIYAGQITALIGPNGSGKSTLIRLLAGDELPTSGQASVLGVQITDPIQRMRVAGQIGVCYQENVLCESLTVWESVVAILVSRGKDAPEQRESSRRLLDRLGLSGRLLSRPATALSGGQQRKLCATLALAGDPRMVLLDEPSSGLDPLSRRSLWAALSENRDSRCLLLSTQFMDEADLLADRKLLLRKGQLKCAGSSLFMKEKYKCGRVAHVETNKPQEVIENIQQAFPDVAAFAVSTHEVKVKASKENLSQVAKWLEDQKASPNSGVLSFGLSLTGLETVFEQQDEADLTAKDLSDASVIADPAAVSNTAFVVCKPSELTQFSALLGLNVRRLRRDPGRVCCRVVLPCLLLAAFLVLLVYTAAKPDSLPSGVNSKYDVIFNWRNKINSVSAVCITDAGSVAPSMNDCELLLTGGGIDYSRKILVLEKPEAMSLQAFLSLPNTQQQFLDACSYANQCPLAYANNWSLADGAEGNARRTVYYGYFFDESQAAGITHIKSLIKGYASVAKYFGVELSKVPDGDTVLSADNATYLTIGATVRNRLTDAVYFDPAMWALLLLIAVIPVGMLSDPIEDRSTGLRSQLRAMGVSSLGYWTSMCLLHWLQYALFCLPAMVAMLAMQPDSYANAYYLVGVFPLLLLIGLPVNQLVVYVASTWVRRSNAVATGLLFVVSFTCGLAPLLAQMSNFFGLLLACLWPPYAAIGLAFYASKAANNAREFYRIAGLGNVPKLGEIYGCNPLLIACLVCVSLHALLLCALLAIREFGFGALLSAVARRCRQRLCQSRLCRGVESGVPPDQADRVVIKPRVIAVDSEKKSTIRCTSPAVEPEENFDDADDGVRHERLRLLTVGSSRGDSADLANQGAPDSVQVLNLAKRYPGGHSRAVNDVTFGASAGQIFGLLGPNGAGKSTTLSVLVGERSASEGRCLVAGLTGREAARLGKIGYCPQYSPLLPRVTVLEHLQFYATVRGLPAGLIDQQARSLAASMGLAEYLDRPAGALSGGNRRRLCLAIALLGNPSVLVIDEASTGVDPENKRSIWKAVRAMAGQDRAVVLTTHSMEEAEALCSRVGIMHSGRLLALGSNQQLKIKYGKKYTLDVQLKRFGDYADSSPDKPDKLSNLLKKAFASNKKLEDFSSWSRYEVELKGVDNPISFALAALDAGCLFESFHLYQASLDQIFIGLLENRKVTLEELDYSAVAKGPLDSLLCLVTSCRGDRAEEVVASQQLIALKDRNVQPHDDDVATKPSEAEALLTNDSSPEKESGKKDSDSPLNEQRLTKQDSAEEKGQQCPINC